MLRSWLRKIDFYDVVWPLSFDLIQPFKLRRIVQLSFFAESLSTPLIVILFSNLLLQGWGNSTVSFQILNFLFRSFHFYSSYIWYCDRWLRKDANKIVFIWNLLAFIIVLLKSSLLSTSENKRTNIFLTVWYFIS